MPRPQPRSTARPQLRSLDLLLAIALILALDAAADWAIAAFIGDETAAARNNADIAWSAAASLNILAVIWLVFLRRRGLTLADLGYVSPRARWATLGVVLGLALIPLEFALYHAIFGAFDLGPEPDWWLLPGAPDSGILAGLTVLAYSGLVVPVAEELLFRGLVFRWARQRLSFWPAAILSAAVFGIAHTWLDTMVAAGLMGLVLAWLYERSGSLAPPILMHQAFNTTIVAVALGIEWSGFAGI